MRAKFGSNSFGYSWTVEPIKKPLSVEPKGFFIFYRIAPNRILVGWRLLNLSVKLLFNIVFVIIKLHGDTQWDTKFYLLSIFINIVESENWN